MDSLKAGNWIYRSWRGSHTASGYLGHTLVGVNRLREAEADVLWKAGKVRIATYEEMRAKHGFTFSFKPYILVETANDTAQQ